MISEAWEYISDLPVVAHNASFDMSVLRHGLDSCGLEYPTAEYFCTLLMSRAHWPELPAYSLPVLSAYCSVPLDHHSAESDAQAAAGVLLHMANECGQTELRKLARSLGVLPGSLYSCGYSPCSRCSATSRPRPKVSIKDLVVNGDADPTHPFWDADIAFTGTLISMKREDAMQLVANRGGRPRTSVSKNTEYLVVGSVEYRSLVTGEPSRKMQKALELRNSGAPIVVLSEQEFLEYL